MGGHIFTIFMVVFTLLLFVSIYFILKTLKKNTIDPFDINIPKELIEPASNMYYKHPNQMTSRQLEKYKSYPHFEKMTPIDYKYWLLIFKNSPTQLSEYHRAQLEKVQKGIELSESDLPKKEYVSSFPEPISAQKFFDSLSDDKSKMVMSSPQISSNDNIIAYNYGDYSYFSPPNTLKHLKMSPYLKKSHISNQSIIDTTPQITDKNSHIMQEQ
jgi:hypothetical protein